MASAGYLLPSPDDASIFYTKWDNPGIFRARRSGLNEELVFNSEGTDWFFSPMLLFPSGNELLAAGLRTGSPNVRISRINLSSHGAVDLGEVSTNSDHPSFVWAEPGNSILFSRPINGLTNIWKYDLKDRSLTQITFGTGPDFSPMPDPGGKGIYYVNGKSSGFLTAYHVQSKEFTDIVSDDATQPSISPDGKRVMYVTLVAGRRRALWVSDIDGVNKVKIANGEDLGTGRWAPDNFHLSFTEAGASGGPRVYIIGADGSGLRQLPSMGYSNPDSAWSADQKSVYVSTGEMGGPKNQRLEMERGQFKSGEVRGQMRLGFRRRPQWEVPAWRRISWRRDWNLRGVHLGTEMHPAASRRSNVRRDVCSRRQIVPVCSSCPR